MTSFFVSYSSADRAWAEWIAWALEDALRQRAVFGPSLTPLTPPSYLRAHRH